MMSSIKFILAIKMAPDAKRARIDGVDTVRHVEAVTEAVDELGRRMVNEFSVVRALGRGSYGEVSLVEHLRTRKAYALKRMRRPKPKPALSLGPFAALSDGVESGGFSAAVRREIAVLKKLSHSHIIALHEVLDDPSSDSVFLVLQLAQRGQLMAGTECAEPVGEALARTHFRALLSALAHMHARGVTHGDLKPENLLVSERGALLIGDFGLARLWTGEAWAHAAPQSGGTPTFCCPERLLGALGGFESLVAADVWAAGGCLHQMLDGRPPFVARSVPELFERIASAEPTIGAAVPPSARDLILGMLRKNPAERTALLKAAQHAWVAGSHSGDPEWSLPHDGGAAIEPNDDEVAHAVSPLDRLVSVALLGRRFAAAVALQRVVRGRLSRRAAMGSGRTCRSAALRLQLDFKARRALASGAVGAVVHAAHNAVFSLFWGCARRRARRSGACGVAST